MQPLTSVKEVRHGKDTLRLVLGRAKATRVLVQERQTNATHRSTYVSYQMGMIIRRQHGKTWKRHLRPTTTMIAHG